MMAMILSAVPIAFFMNIYALQTTFPAPPSWRWSLSTWRHQQNELETNELHQRLLNAESSVMMSAP